ncbi:MAG: hypothetical protein ACD_44C00092G0006 [uncultured bacterium]|nr:MAG: hypothetical protein ACD_44C00092G0006 [uncultured bacterium]OGT16956.1 MAG: hypothetical protein A3B69_00315 [Gammaproteobacteria bacterium RIFCSPHIGHO2_02_FULL_38_33]OGT23277.1 MAG: hypothetical protein A2W47_06560 [Gammaproteobacteria bacterium RIFCSPHIGHO2_12_38_15]OGT69465.1 MAG: hypothetical protein A3I12_02470 [Gammaproteobacteria bacterium RIFCSPLOWO2_02_FULL_38_11]OGT77086.1 MAG: hypothetical protein A3G71_04050 [Gammaproteobacteria bacterium RIFCSPLOWO2_12_FULL_38_14]
MAGSLVTILIPNYKTLALTKLCLRLIRKNTDLSKITVIVIDNDSQDESLDYLRKLTWIDLIERPTVAGEPGFQAHAAALDLGLLRTTTPYVLSIHTDTFVKNPQWLEFLISEIEKSPRIAGVGSWKLESKSFYQRILKSMESHFQKNYYKLINKKNHALEGVGKNYFYLRSHCAMYRTDLLHELGLNFSEEGEVAGKLLHRRLLDAGYEMRFLESKILINYIEHINHATMVLNPALQIKTRDTKGLKRIQESLDRLNAQTIFINDQFDQMRSDK